MGEEVLFGIWFSLRYGPGSMSDEAIAFQPDHRGFWRFTNAGGAYVEAFRWTMNGDETLTISGTASYEVDYLPEGHRVVEGPGGLHFDGLPFRIEPEDTPWKRVMEVLTLDEGHDRWRKSLLDTFGILSEKFGLRRRDLGPRDLTVSHGGEA